MTINADYEHQ